MYVSTLSGQKQVAVAGTSGRTADGADSRRFQWLQAEALVAKAHTICPYSKATRGNIEVKLLANGKPVEGGPK